MNGTMWCKAKSIWPSSPPKTAKILPHDIFCFFMRDEEFVSKTINVGSVDLEKFPASRVCQLAKKIESSKATARHIRQVAGDPQASQINLLWHQHTKLPLGKHKKRKPVVRKSQPHPKNTEKQTSSQFKRKFDPKLVHKNTDRCSKCGDSAQQKGSSTSHATSLVTIQASLTKEASTSKFSSRLGNLRHTNYRQAHCICKIVPFAANLKIQVQKILSVFNLRYSTTKQVSRTFLLLLI